ncbi:hypothetical protein NMY22_g276 [Coprinellus aureogranulatus]|nr:hypothetical protein NMY22_g276 [Coprinellus aureogranulatus]
MISALNSLSVPQGLIGARASLHREAPRWDGSPLTRQDDFEDMCRRYRVPQERMFEAPLRLAPSYDTRAIWKGIASDFAAGTSWHDLHELYPRHHAEDPLPLKEVYDVIVFVLSIARECFQDELVPLTHKTSSIEQHHSERMEQHRDSLRESTGELSLSIEKLGDVLNDFAARPKDTTYNTKTVANPKPTPLPQSSTPRFRQSVLTHIAYFPQRGLRLEGWNKSSWDRPSYLLLGHLLSFDRLDFLTSHYFLLQFKPVYI